jgi:hypothetical protein
MVDELDDYEEQQMDENFKKLQLWQARKAQRAGLQRQKVLEQETFEEVASEFGMPPEELSKKISTVEDSTELAELESLFKEKLRDYWRERAAMKVKKVAGNRLQDKQGKFTSPRKIASEKAYAQKVAEMRERVERGGRLSEDELLEIMPRLR